MVLLGIFKRGFRTGVLKSYINMAKEFVEERGEPTIDESVEVSLG